MAVTTTITIKDDFTYYTIFFILNKVDKELLKSHEKRLKFHSKDS